MRLGLGDGSPELVEHRSARLDGHDLEPDADEAACQLPGSRSHIEDAGTGLQPELLGRPAQRFLRVLRPVPLVLRRDGFEAARALRHGSTGRGR